MSAQTFLLTWATPQGTAHHYTAPSLPRHLLLLECIRTLSPSRTSIRAGRHSPPRTLGTSNLPPQPDHRPHHPDRAQAPLPVHPLLQGLDRSGRRKTNPPAARQHNVSGPPLRRRRPLHRASLPHPRPNPQHPHLMLRTLHLAPIPNTNTPKHKCRKIRRKI